MSETPTTTTQARKKSTKIRFLGPETARWGGGLPREGVVAENFVPALETLSSLGFEERNPGCPGNFAGMSRTPGGVQKVRAKKLRAHFSFPNYFSKKYRNTPPICIAIRLQFVPQYFWCPYALRKGKYCQYSSHFVSQYASHLYCNTPPICIAVLLGKSWWLWSPECSPILGFLSLWFWLFRLLLGLAPCGIL